MDRAGIVTPAEQDGSNGTRERTPSLASGEGIFALLDVLKIYGFAAQKTKG